MIDIYIHENTDVTHTETKIVVVDTVCQFRHRYLVEVPVDCDEHDLRDLVPCVELAEVSQDFLGEAVVAWRPVTLNETLDICRSEDNNLYQEWTDQLLLSTFVNRRSQVDD